MDIIYKVPKHWNDLYWLENRNEFLIKFERADTPLTLDFSECEWIDLHPLIDSHLMITTHCLSGGKVFLKFFESSEINETQRLVHFLKEAGFFSSFYSNKSIEPLIEAEIQGTKFTLKTFIEKIDKQYFPPKALEQEIIVPCSYVDLDVDEIDSRDDVFNFCQRMRIDYASHKRLDGLRISKSLMHEARLFFNIVLPELIDNVRLHKRFDKVRQFSFFMRLRRRDDSPPYSARKAAEPNRSKLSLFAKSTEHYWEHDIIEAVFSDNGSGIQDTFIKAWNDKEPGKIPKKAGTKVDGKDGDFHILRAIFEENRSSLSRDERLRHGLPLMTTGLHSLRRSIEGANFSFAVRSGLNYALCTPAYEGSSNTEIGKTKIRKGIRYNEKTPGVQYFFRIASLANRPLDRWINGLPKEGILSSPDWWINEYPAKLDKIHFVETYQIPNNVSFSDVVVCRAHHACWKHELIDFINKAHDLGVQIVFAEMPAPIALRIYRLVHLLSRENTEICIPVITNTLQVKIAGNVTEMQAAMNFAHGHKTNRKYWWNDPQYPVQNLKDIFLASRKHDSLLIWNSIMQLEGSFISEPVKWSKRWVLSGGYLSFYAMLRSRVAKKILRRRMVLFAQSIGASKIIPATDSLRHLAREISTHCFLENDGPTVVIDSVSATGLTQRMAFGMLPDSKTAVYLPSFIYPNKRIVDRNNTHKDRSGIPVRVFDWREDVVYPIVWSDDGKPLNARLWRKGNSNVVTAMPKDIITYSCQQGPSEAYKIWQRDRLLDVGHFSYGNHHWYVWVDLRRFIVDKSTDLHEMIEKMLHTIELWKPAWVFYASHETTEELMQALWKEAEGQNNDCISENASWALDDLAGFTALLTPQTASSILGNSIAVIIDDASVTGKTIQKGKYKIKQLGFKVVHSMVVLDRQNPEIYITPSSTNKEEHFSWWSLEVPPTGTTRSCRICNGIQTLQKVSNSTVSGSVKDTLSSWIDNWQRSDNLQRFENAIQGISFDEALNKRLASLEKPNLKIHTSEAACAWSIEIAERLEWPSFLAEDSDDSDHKLGDSLTECLAGTLLHNWDNLQETYKRALTIKLINRIWNDPRISGRRLAAVCLSSFRDKEQITLLDLLRDKVKEDGIPSMDVAVFLYVVLLNAKSNKKDRIDWLILLQNHTIQNKKTFDPGLARETVSFLQALETTQCSDIKGWDVLLSIGFPGRSSDHENIFSVIYRLQKADMSGADQTADLSLLRMFLEPIEQCFEEQKWAFANELSISLNSAITDFKLLCEDKVKLFDKDCLIDVVTEINDVLNVSRNGFPSIRSAIVTEYLHYLPFVVREQVKYISKVKLKNGTFSFDEDDFLLESSEISDEESQLLEKAYQTPSERAQLLMTLHNYTIALSSNVSLVSAVRDCLADVKHPKSRGLGIYAESSPPYMRVRFKDELHTSRFGGHASICIIFENKATHDQAEEAAGTSWYAVQDYMNKTGAFAETEQEDGMVRRKLHFRAYGHKN